jgi:hypothetical protein
MKSIIVISFLNEIGEAAIKNLFPADCDVKFVYVTENNKDFGFLKALETVKKIGCDYLFVFDGDWSIFNNIEDKLNRIKYNSVGMLSNVKNLEYRFGWYIDDNEDIYLSSGWHGIEEYPKGTFYRWSDSKPVIKVRNDITNLQLVVSKSGHVKSDKLKITINKSSHIECSTNEFGIVNIPLENGINDFKIVEIETDTFIPTEKEAGSMDTRSLGFQLKGISYNLNNITIRKNTESIKMSNNMYCSNTLIQWRILFGISLPLLHYTKSNKSYNFILTKQLITRVSQNAKEINRYLQALPQEQFNCYLSDMLSTISYLCSNTLEKQILTYE